MVNTMISAIIAFLSFYIHTQNYQETVRATLPVRISSNLQRNYIRLFFSRKIAPIQEYKNATV